MNPKRNTRILVVDDEPDVLVVLKKRLETEGFSVLEASTGRLALSLAKAEKPDLIILDVCLPDIGGGEVACGLQEDPVTASIPIIFLTALFSKQEEAKHGRLVGGNKTMAKPYETRKLIAEIERSLQEAGTLYQPSSS